MLYTVPDSHFWTNIKMMLNWLDSVDRGIDDNFTTEYIRKGLLNTLENGYDITKLPKKEEGK